MRGRGLPLVMGASRKMEFIHINLKTKDGGFIIPESEDGEEIAEALLEHDKTYVRVKEEGL